jgi:hypothetical protein
MSIAISIPGAERIPHHWNPRLAGIHYWIRRDHIPQAGLVLRCGSAPAASTPDWSVTSVCERVSQQPAVGEVVRSNPGEYRLFPPPAGARFDISCAAGAETQQVTLWAIEARILFHTRGQVSGQNESWRRPTAELGLPTTARPALGLRTIRDFGSGTTGYAALIEIVGEIVPRDTPLPFHLVRRLLNRRVTTWNDRPIQRPRGFDDTTDAAFQDTSPSRDGRVYDLDGPGSFFNAADATGAWHEWRLLFEQRLVIGPLGRGNAFQTALDTHRVVAAPRIWRAYFKARVREQGNPPTIEFDTGGYVGP